eukprot:8991340-Pyramimonas_sp.AAC.1
MAGAGAVLAACRVLAAPLVVVAELFGRFERAPETFADLGPEAAAAPGGGWRMTFRRPHTVSTAGEDASRADAKSAGFSAIKVVAFSSDGALRLVAWGPQGCAHVGVAPGVWLSAGAREVRSGLTTVWAGLYMA